MSMSIQKLILIVLLLIFLILLISLLFNLPPFSGNNGLLKVCKFNEVTGANDVCFWRWDPALREPSIYF